MSGTVFRKLVRSSLREAGSGATRMLTEHPMLRVHARWWRGHRNPGRALQALLGGATLAVKSDGEDRVNRQAGRSRER
jgi:hypothetical protein